MVRFKIESFSLIELMVVVVVLGILVSVALPQYRRAVERSIDREAQSNLMLIQAGQKIYKMKNQNYYGPQDSISSINTNLGVDLTETNFDYNINAANATAFITKATRQAGKYAGHYWVVDPTSIEPTCFPGTSSCP